MLIESLVPDRPGGREIDDEDVLAGRRHPTWRRFKECPICCGVHEKEIHDATLSVHQWFRAEVTKGFDVIFE